MISKILMNPILRFLLLLGVLMGLVFIVQNTREIKTRISNIVFDTYIQISPREPSDKLVFVDIDDVSLSLVGQMPWPRTQIAEMVRNLKESGASVIIFDGVIAEPDRTSPENVAAILGEDHPAYNDLASMPSNDEILAQTIGDVGNFVAGFSAGSNPKPPLIKSSILIKSKDRNFFLSQKTHGFYFKKTAQFLPDIQKQAAGNGSFMASADDADSVIRHTRLFFHNGKTIYPSLILEGARLHSHTRTNTKIFYNPDYSDFRLFEPFITQVGDYKIPTSADGKMWVHYRRFDKDESVSAYKFLDEYYKQEASQAERLNGKVNKQPQDLSGKIVFIASSAEGLMDLRSTPIGFQPGVKVHMNAMEQILEGDYLIRPYVGEALEIWGTAVIAVLIILISFFVGPIWLATLTTAASVGAFWMSWYMFKVHGGLIDPVTPSLMLMVIFVTSSVLSYIRSEMERRQVSTAFGHYISPDFMEELTKNPDKLKLGGEIRELSVLFSDIRSFTTISEGLTPEELIQLMNDFLTPMSDLVMQNKGTIDKYMGDAMMAFWNAPLDDPHHARHACVAALGMQKALAPINEGVRKKAEELGKKPVLLQAGIGINTGPCAVGNMGSKQRFAYSTLGDAVNLASRLEGQTKNYGASILIGHETYIAVPEFAALEYDLIQVKGKTKPEHVYGLLGDEEEAQTDEFQKLKTVHAQMIEQYRGQEFDNALKSIKACRDLCRDDMGALYDLYEQRISDMKNDPPGKDWDGVFVATSK